MNTLNQVVRFGGVMQSRAFTLVALLLFSTASMLIDTSEATTSGRAMACSGTVCLNEALPNPSGYDNAAWPNGEWMEIWTELAQNVAKIDGYNEMTGRKKRNTFLISDTLHPQTLFNT